MNGQCNAKVAPAQTEKKVSPANPPRILLAEDDFEMRKLLAWSLGKNGYEVVECQDGYSLMKNLGFLDNTELSNNFALIISDIRMPGLTGLEVMQNTMSFVDFPPMILITAFPNEEVIERAKQLGAAAILAKPFDFDELLLKIRQLLPKSPSAEEQPGRKQINLHFPLYINFHNCFVEQSVKDFIREKAARLNRFADYIMLCRIVIHESAPQEQRAHRYYVSIILTVSGKTIVALQNSDKNASGKNLCITIGIAFDKACHQLKKYLCEQKPIMRNYCKNTKKDGLL